MQPLQYYLRDPAAKDNSLTHVAAARSNLDAAITLRSAETELELRVTASEIAAPKPDLDAKAAKRRFWSTSWKKIEKENYYCQNWQNLPEKITIAALMQPLQYDLQCPAAKDNSKTHAAAAPSNLDAAITMRFAAWHG